MQLNVKTNFKIGANNIKKYKFKGLNKNLKIFNPAFY